MHMSDALLSPAVGGALWAASAAALAWASRGLQRRADDRLVPLMGVLGAFVFAAQMINFSIPGTGSSGHLGGGLLLTLLLGPRAALVVIASVLTVQALLFADGGLLALGANIFNLGVLPCLVAWPLVYRPLAGAAPSPRRRALAAVAAAVVGLQLGAVGVVLQTVGSGVSSLPIGPFAGLMLPIHAAIGVVEGLATAALVLFLHRQRPELLADAPAAPAPTPLWPLRPVLRGLAGAAVLVGGVLSWFASAQPDGLEWSLARAAGGHEPAAPSAGVHALLADWQQRSSWLPGYALPSTPPPADQADAGDPAWPAVDAGTSLAGLLGGAATAGLLVGVGALLRRRRPGA
jgi:cobalt/nickel transport system permease protein